MDGSLLGFPDAFLVALISAPRADATSLAAFSNICCNKHNNEESKAEENVTFFQCKATLTVHEIPIPVKPIGFIVPFPIQYKVENKERY